MSALYDPPRPKAPPEQLKELARNLGYWADFQPTVRRRGWPMASDRPYHLRWNDSGAFIAAFKTVEALERNLRARGGC